jgi:hypothetical protein
LPSSSIETECVPSVTVSVLLDVVPELVAVVVPDMKFTAEKSKTSGFANPETTKP